MLRVFNCGIGMVLVVEEAKAEAAIALLREHGEAAHRIGRIEAGEGEAEVRTEGLSPAWPT